MEAKKTLLSTLMVSGLVLGGYAGLAHTQHQDFNTNFTAIAHADATEGTIMKFSDGCSVVAKRDAQGNQVYDYVTKDGVSNQIPDSTNMTVADKGNDALVLSDNISYTVVKPGGSIYMTSSIQGMRKNIEMLNNEPNVLYFGVAKYNTVGNTKIPVAFTKIVKDDNGKYYVQTEYGVTTGNLAVKKDSDGKTISTWMVMASPTTAALSGNADVTTADNGDVTIKFNPSDEGYTNLLQKQDGTYTNNLLSRGKSATNSSSSASSSTATVSSSSLNLSANEINTANDGKDKVSRVITYSVQTPDGLKQVGSYTYNGAENQFNADQVAQKNLPKGYKIVQMLDVPTVGADGSNDSNAFTYLVEKDTTSAASSSVTPSAASSSDAKASSTVASIVGSGSVSDANHSSAASSISAKPSDAKDTAKDSAVSASSESAKSSETKSDAKDVSGAVKGSSSAKSSSVVSSSESSHSMSSKYSVSSKASSKSSLSKSSSSKVESSSNESSKSSSLEESASSKSAESDKNLSVSDKDTNSAVTSSSQNVGSQSSSVIGQAGADGQSGQNGGSSAAPEANTTNPGDGTTTTTSTSTSPADDTYSPQKAAMLAKTNAKAAQSGIIAAIGAVIGTVAGWFGLKKKNL